MHSGYFCGHVPEERLELSHLAIHDFESCASTIPPLRHFYFIVYTALILFVTYILLAYAECDHSLVESLLTVRHLRGQADSTTPAFIIVLFTFYYIDIIQVFYLYPEW